METNLDENHRFEMAKVSTLVAPEYYQKEVIEGRQLQLSKSIRRNGLKSPIIINCYPGRENIVINGLSVVKSCRELGMLTIPAWVISVPLEQEKELHFSLNNQITDFSVDAIRALLNRSYSEFFPGMEFDDVDKALMDGAQTMKRTPLNDRAKPITGHLNHEERRKFEIARIDLKCKSDSDTVKKLTDYYLKEQGLI